MVDFENLKGVFAKLPEEPTLIDEEKENTTRLIAAAYIRRLLFNGN